MNSRPSGSPAAILVLLLCLALSVCASCTSTKGNDVNPSLTEETARVHLIDYFRETLTSLPKFVSLALEPAAPGDAAKYNAGTAAPCDDKDKSGSGPVNLGLNYWVHGVAPAENAECFHKVVQIWRDWKWHIEEDSTSGFLRGRATSPENYSLTVIDNGFGGLSIIGSSPCFPRTAAGTSTPQPSTVPHP